MRRFLLALLLIVVAVPAFAVEPGERLKDPVLEGRAREISQQLRCLVCQNQSIDDSNAELAADLRRIVRQRLVAGDTDQQVLDYVVARYGEFVLLRPRFEPATLLLWIGPLIALLAGAAVAIGLFRRNQGRTPPELDADEQARVDRIMNDIRR